MKKILSFLSFCSILISSHIYASDILMLETFDDTTVLPYQVRIQMGVEAQEQVDTSLLLHTPQLDAAFGIGEWAEFGFNYEILALTDSPHFDDKIGSGDVRLRLKLVPLKTHLGNLGFLVITKIPTANHEDGLGSDETDVILKTILATTVFKDLHLFANFGIAIQGDILSESSQDDFLLWGIGMRYPLSSISKASLYEDLSVIGEFEGSFGPQNNDNVASGEYTDRDAEVRLGLVKNFSWFNLGITGSLGINEDSPEWRFQVILSRTFDVPRSSKK